MSFYEYVSAKMPDFENIFTTKEIEEIKKLFTVYALWCQVKKTNIQILETSRITDEVEEKEAITSREVLLKQILDSKIDAVIADHFDQFNQKFSTK